MMNEFEIIVDQVRRRKEAFIQRLSRNVMVVQRHMPEPCQIWTGTSSRYYGRITFRLVGMGNRKESHVQLDAHRVFLILKLGRPIADNMEAGHTCGESLCMRHIEEQTRTQNLQERDARKKGSKNRRP